MSESRIQSFDEFWPYYLGEHRNATCRILHFFGTTAFFSAFGLSFWSAYQAEFPWFAVSFAATFAVGWLAFAFVERRRAATLPLLLMIGLIVAAPPHFYVLGGVVFAYAMAWIGHFKVEHNRPATFTYPLWSFLADFRMWGVMATGGLWSGDSMDWYARRYGRVPAA